VVSDFIWGPILAGLILLLTGMMLMKSVSAMSRWQVWHADVPFAEKDDSKYRPVVVLGSAKTADGKDGIAVLYVTSKDKDSGPGSENYRAVYPGEWTIGPEDERKTRSWVRIDETIVLSPRAFDRKIGELTADEQEKIARNLKV